MNAMHFSWLVVIFLCLNKVQAQFYGDSAYGSSGGQSIRLGE